VSEARDEAVMGAIVALMPPLLNAMETLGFVARYMHPPRLGELVASVSERDAAVSVALEQFRAVQWPEHLSRFREVVEQAADATLAGFDGLRAAVQSPDGVLLAYRALRRASDAMEALYPVSAVLPAVSRFFVEPELRDDAALLARLAKAERGRERVGIMHADNEKGSRGGFSLYVPEYYDEAVPCPLVMAMHGGSGHGRTFLWSWLREARSRGAILISPTAVGTTWSLMDPDIDSDSIANMLGYVRENWNVDASRMLLTGMSDGGTFSLVSGLRSGSPFTHLAPFAASFHPFLLELMDAKRVSGLPIYLVHGALDWMFPVDQARASNDALSRAGARVTYREIDDLSHTYARDENPRILDWLAETPTA
jgi:phospholipase/carboxylesterase